jgi:hypothetical protein
MIFNLAVQYAIRRVQVYQDSLEFNGTLQLLAYADKCVGLRRTYCKEKHRSLLLGSKEIGIEVNVGKTKYMVTSRNQNAG